MTKDRVVATVASAVAAACLALTATHIAIQSQAPEAATDTTVLEALTARAETAEAERDSLAARLDAAQLDAQYTACMYGLNALNPASDMIAAQWSCTRNASSFALLTYGSQWDARQYADD